MTTLVTPGSGLSKVYTVGGSAIMAGRVLYASAGAVAHARADAKATARGIVGVSTHAAAAGSLVATQRTGVVLVAADSTCSPVFGARAYLSTEADGKASSAINGTVYPRCLGRFVEDAVQDDGMVAVDLDVNEERDDGETLLELWAPTEDAYGHTFNISPALFDDMLMVVSGYRKTGSTGATIPRIQFDGSDASMLYAGIRTDGFYSGTGVFNISSTNTVHSNLEARFTFGQYAMVKIHCDGADSGTIITCRGVPPTTSIGIRMLDNSIQNTYDGFEGGYSTVKLYGHVKR